MEIESDDRFSTVQERETPRRRVGALALLLAFLLFVALGHSVTRLPSGGLRPASEPSFPAPNAVEPASPPRADAPLRIDPVVLAAAVEVVEREVGRGAFPGAALAIGVGERVELLRGVGRIGWTSNASEVDPAETRYDLASVTKAMATVPAVLLLVEEGRMGLDEPVARYLPVFSGGGKDAVTIRHLLTHTSGLPAGAILRGEARWQKIDRLLRRIPVNGAPGRRVEYSDVGYVILYEAARRAAGEPLPNYLQRRLWEPLGMTSTGFSPGLDCEECAPTGRLRDGRLYRGRPFDETAQSLDGITGNAGVFSTARDVARFAAMIANGGELDGVRIFRPETVREFARAQPGTGTRTLGWEIFCRGKPVPSNQRCDDPYAFGHTGWTGTSVWIDPERGVWVVLLTNRTYETRAPSRIAEVRRELFDRAMGEAPERGSSPRAR